MKIDFIFLLKAIKENQNISIYQTGKKKPSGLRFFSRFLHVQIQTKTTPKTIIIDLPYVDGYTDKHLKSGDTVSIEFHEAGFRFHFKTSVLGPIELNVKGGAHVPALKIEWPKEILDGNRRSMYRAAVYLDSFPKISYFIMERVNSKAQEEEFSEFKGIEALMIDISENGAAVKIKRKVNVQVGDRIKLIFLLEADEQLETELEGVIRNIRQFPNGDVHVCGIQFDPDYVSHYKHVLCDIACYVMSLNRDNVNFLLINQIVSNNPFVQWIINHEVDEDVLSMLINKELPFNDFEFLESLVYVMDIKLYREKIEPLLNDIPVSLKGDYVQRLDANYKVAHYILKEAIGNSNYKIIAGIIGNPYLPVEFLTPIALNGTPQMLRLLLANKIRLIAYPKIMDLMEENPKITASIRTKITNLKNQYFKARNVSKISDEDITDYISEIISEKWDFAYESGTGEDIKTFGKNSITSKVLTILQRINSMSMSERIKLAIFGNKTERLILAKDTNKMTHLALIESPEITEYEILELIKSKKIHREVIHEICRNKKWTDNYLVMLALLKNKKVLKIKISVFILQLHLRDLKDLVRDKTIHPIVYKLANDFYGKKK